MSVSTACQSQLNVSLNYKGITKNFYSMIRMCILTTCQPRLQRYFASISVSMICQPQLHMHMHQCFLMCMPRDTKPACPFVAALFCDISNSTIACNSWCEYNRMQRLITLVLTFIVQYPQQSKLLSVLVSSLFQFTDLSYSTITFVFQ